MQIGTGQVDPDELTQGRVDLGKELTRDNLTRFQVDGEYFEGKTTKNKYKFNTKSD